MVTLRFRAAAVVEVRHNGELTSVRVILVPNESSESKVVNHHFWRGKPSGVIELIIDNPAGFDFIKQDGEYSISIGEAL